MNAPLTPAPYAVPAPAHLRGTHDLTLSALVRLYAEIGGKIKQNHDEYKRLQADMRAVEAVIKLLDPDYDTSRIAARGLVKTNPWFRKGEAYRSALDILRKAEKPLTAREIAERMIAPKGVSHVSPKQLRSLAAGVMTSLRNHLGRTTERVGEGYPHRWMLIGK